MLSLSYYLLSLLMVFLMLLAIYKLQKKRGKNPKPAIQYAIFMLIIWFSYLFNQSLSGFLFELQMPPRIPLFLFLPIAIFTILFCRRAVKSAWIKDLPLTWLTYPQCFRIFVELILLYTFYAGIIPKEATFEGLNFDVLMGISAPFMAYFIFHKTRLNKGIAVFWNIFGILMILFVAFIIGSSFYNPSIWGQSSTMVSNQFLAFPYLLVAGFLAPLGIFMHAVSLAKIKAMN